MVKDGQWVGYAYYVLNDQISKDARLLNSMTEIAPRQEYTELLKMGIFTGEFERMELKES